MARVSIRDLRNKGGEVVYRAARGETVTITKSGRPIAELHPIPQPGVAADVLLARWRRLPAIDPGRLKSDIDATLDSRL
jgi:prevent-host-death family protein